MTSLRLAVFVGASLVSIPTGCCPPDELETHRETRMVRLEDDELWNVLVKKQTDGGRCETGCLKWGNFEGAVEEVISCEAVGDDESLPTWDSGQVAVTVTCTVEYTTMSECPPI